MIADDRAGTGWGSVSLLKKLDTENYNVIVVSPRNYFLFTPLLPSCTVGTIEHRSIMEPIRNFLRHKKAAVKYYEAEATKIDYEKRVVYVNDDSHQGRRLADRDPLRHAGCWRRRRERHFWYVICESHPRPC